MFELEVDRSVPLGGSNRLAPSGPRHERSRARPCHSRHREPWNVVAASHLLNGGRATRACHKQTIREPPAISQCEPSAVLHCAG